MDTSSLRHPIVGIAAAALAGPTAFFIYGLLAGPAPAEFHMGVILLAAFIIYTFGLTVSVPVALAFGLPYVLWLQSRGRLNWANVCGGATTAGTATFTVLWAASFQSYKPIWVFAGLGFASGLLSGAAFCAVVRPNNSFKSKPLRGSA